MTATTRPKDLVRLPSLADRVMGGWARLICLAAAAAAEYPIIHTVRLSRSLHNVTFGTGKKLH